MKSKLDMSKSLDEVNSTIKTKATGSFIKKFLAFSGPAYLISVGYMDPGNWATDIAGGSQFGYQLLWVLLMSNGMALLLQTLSTRLGLVTGLDLAQASRKYYPKLLNIPLFLLAQVAIIACDLAEVLGFAIGLKLLTGLSLMNGVIISILDTFIILLLQQYGIRKLEAFIISLVAIIGLSFLIELFFSQPDLHQVANGLMPSSLSPDALLIAIGIIGATVMPHNLYLHSALVQTRTINRDDKAHLKTALKFNFIDSLFALNLAFLVNAAILILAASVFYIHGMNQIADIVDAHRLLQSLLGSKIAPVLFAVALIASGQSSTITGTLAGQIITEGYLDLKMKPWLRRFLTRSLAILPAIGTLIFWGESKITSLLILSQVVLSMQLGFAIIPLIHFVSNKTWMNEFVIKNWVKVLSWFCATIILVLNIQLVATNLSAWLKQDDGFWISAFKYGCLLLVIAAFCLLLYIIIYPLLRKKQSENDIK